MNLARTLLLATTWPKVLAYRRSLADPARAQSKVWRSTWKCIGGAPRWKGFHDGRGVPPLADFPLTTYDDYRDALDRSFETGVSELSGDPVVFWSVSAGSTGPRKLFPITEHYRKQFQTTTPPYLHAVARRYKGMLANPLLYFAGTMPTERSPSGVEVGFISNYNYRSIPPMLRKMYAFPTEVLADADTFRQWGPLYALATDLSAMVGITPSIMVQFFRGIEDRAEQYLAILEGKASPPSHLPPVPASADRAACVRRGLTTGRLQFEDVWPGLQLIACWKAATCGLQLPSLREHSGAVPIIDATYSATEGWINVPRPDGRVGGPVHPGAHVVELLPRGADSATELVPLQGAEVGSEYEIVLTTSMGLVRYRLFDVVQCTAMEGDTPVIEFVQKSTNEISLGPACVSEAELGAALVAAGIEASEERFFAPATTGNGLEWVMTGNDEVDVNALESALCEQNPMYAKYVAEGALVPIATRTVPADHPALHRGHHAQSKPRLLQKTPVDNAS